MQTWTTALGSTICSPCMRRAISHRRMSVLYLVTARVLVAFKQLRIDTSLRTLGQHKPTRHAGAQHHTSLTPSRASGGRSAPSRPPPAPCRHPAPAYCPCTGAWHPQAPPLTQPSRPTGSSKPRARAGRLAPFAVLKLLPCLDILTAGPAPLAPGGGGAAFSNRARGFSRCIGRMGPFIKMRGGCGSSPSY
jgi:hypothetical protein